MDLSRRLEVAEEENLLLRERISNLEAQLFASRTLPKEWRLTGQEAKVFGALVNKELASKDNIYFALYGDRTDGGVEMKIIDVFICKMRKKLTPFDVIIKTVWGQGYSLDERTRNEFKKEKS